MECPRCGENNLPGLPTCLGCGRSLAPDAQAPVMTVPRVHTKNPLSLQFEPQSLTAEQRGQRDLAFRFLTPRVILFARAMLATLKGWLPGLGPILRGDFGTTRVFGGALLVILVLIGLTWQSDANGFILVGLQLLLVTAGGTEAYQVLGELRPAPRWVAAAIFGWAGMALQLSAFFFVFNLGWMTVHIMYGTPALPAGVYLGERHLEDTPDVGEFVVAMGGELEIIAPVIAVAGQTVSSERTQVWVDDRQVDLERLARNVRPERRETFVVPEGHVVLLDESLDPRRVSRLIGRIIWCWTPEISRGAIPPAAIWLAGEDP